MSRFDNKGSLIWAAERRRTPRDQDSGGPGPRLVAATAPPAGSCASAEQGDRDQPQPRPRRGHQPAATSAGYTLALLCGHPPNCKPAGSQQDSRPWEPLGNRATEEAATLTVGDQTASDPSGSMAA